MPRRCVDWRNGGSCIHGVILPAIVVTTRTTLPSCGRFWAGECGAMVVMVERKQTTSSGVTRPGLPAVDVSQRPLRDVTGDAVAALHDANDPPAIFVQSSRLVRVRRDEHNRPFVEQLTDAALRGH